MKRKEGTSRRGAHIVKYIPFTIVQKVNTPENKGRQIVASGLDENSSGY